MPLRLPLLDLALAVLHPAACLGCHELAPQAYPIGLCLRCRGQLRRARPGHCARCGHRGADPCSAAGRCPACRELPASVSAVFAPYLYADPLAQVVWSYKFRRLAYLADDFAQLLVTALGADPRFDLADYDLIAPVPLHWLRRLGRGYDQAALLARHLGAHLGIAVAHPLRRQRLTAAQSALARAERLANLRQAFVPRRRGSDLRGSRVLLVDDVVTTGATLEAAASALRRSGATRVDAVAIARTPPRPRAS